MEPYRVFIPSVMKRSIENLLAEREATRAGRKAGTPKMAPIRAGAKTMNAGAFPAARISYRYGRTTLP